MQRTRQATKQHSVLGRSIAAPTWQRLAKNTTAGLWDSNVFFAALMTGVIWGVLWNSFLGTTFWPGMPGEDPELARSHLWIGLGVGCCWAAIAGGWSYRYLNQRSDARSPAARPGRLLGMHRLHSVALGGFFALAAVAQSWAIDRRFGGTTAAIILAELAAGYYFLPVLLRYLAGEYPRLWQQAAKFERMALVLLGFLAVLNLFVPTALGQSNHFLSGLLHLICLVFVPWLPALTAWALIHFRTAIQER